MHCITTDSDETSNKWNHLACFAHTLNLIDVDSIKQNADIAGLIQEVENIVAFFHRSTKANDNLKLNQNHLNIPNHKLIKSVETRWNSVYYYMLEHYLEQQEAVRTTLVLMDRNDLLISTYKNELIKEIISALQPFKAITTEMSGEK